MPDLVMTTAFKNIDKTINITFNISMRILNRISHTCLRGKIYDYVKFFIRKKHGHGIRIFKIHANELIAVPFC